MIFYGKQITNSFEVLGVPQPPFPRDSDDSFKPGSDLFLVINQSADAGGRFWVPTHTALVSKVVWRIAM